MEFDTNGGARFHPTEDRIVFISDRFGFYQLMEQDLKTGETSRLLETENRCTNPQYLHDGTLIFSSDVGGDENFQLYALKDGEVTQITHHPKSKFRFAFSTEEYLYYSANVEESKRFDVYRMKIPLGGEPELVTRGFDFLPLSPRCVSKDGKLVLIKSLGNLWNEMFIFDGELASLTDRYTEKKPRFLPVEFVDEDTLLIVSDYERDFLTLALFDLKTGGINFLEETEWDTSDVKYEDGRLYYLKNIDGSSRFHMAKLDGRELRDVQILDSPDDMGVFVSGDFRSFTSSYDVKGSQIVASFSSSTSPTNVMLYDGSWKQLTGKERDYSSYNFVNPVLERFASFDGLIVPYFFYSSGSPRSPTILMIHGGPEGMFRPSFSKVIQMFVRLGFNVAAPNIRGSNGYGRLYLSLDDIEKRLDSIADIKHLADHLEGKDEVDGSKLVVYGGSYGGYAVLASITEYPERYAAAVDIVGISDLYTFLKNTAPWRRRIREVEYGFLDRDEDVLRRVSPIHKVDRIITPTLIIQGDNDERVPLSESIQIHEKLTQRGVRCELLRFADEGHGVTKRKNQLVQFDVTLKFLFEVLGIEFGS